MGRIRTLKPEFFRSRSLARCSVCARLTFQGLWTEADDFGRGVADTRLLKGAIWALDDAITPETVESHLAELAETGHIVLYESDGERYYAIINWEKHQAASHRRGAAVYPPPPAQTESCTFLHADACKEVQDACDGMQKNALARARGTGNREQGTGKRVTPAASFDDDFAELWEAAAKREKDSRADALKAYTARRRAGASHDDLLRAVAAYRDDPQRQPMYTMRVSRFLGTGDHWRGYLEQPPHHPSVVLGAPRAVLDYGEPIELSS